MALVITSERVVVDKGSAKSAGKIEDGTVRGQVYVGTGASGRYVLIDGENNRIVIHDGTVPRSVDGNV